MIGTLYITGCLGPALSSMDTSSSKKTNCHRNNKPQILHQNFVQAFWKSIRKTKNRNVQVKAIKHWKQHKKATLTNILHQFS